MVELPTPNVCPASRAQWRAWLEKHHTTENKIYLIKYKKHTGKPSVFGLDAMHEAICFGWIDTIVRRIDDDRYSQCFMRRTEKSRWSKNTLAYAKKLIAEGKMTPQGLKYYKEGLKKPVIDSPLPKNPKVPADLKAALLKEKLYSVFICLAPSYRRVNLVWLHRAKLPATRIKRIAAIVSSVKKKALKT